MVGDVKWSNRTGGGGEGVALSLPEGSASGGGGLVIPRSLQPTAVQRINGRR